MLRKAFASAFLLISLLQLTACGGGGSSSNPPPDPASIAPPLSPTGITPFDQATAFLYTGDKPIQTGVLDGVIEARRVAVLRGKVLDRDNQPLAGVTITVLDHPELGQTLSREDGMFDIAVNGGGLLTINYKKDGFLPSQRQVQTPWQDYAWLPEVVLIPTDQAVSTIDLTRSSTLQVARGSVVTDDDGKRQATVLFPQGVQAEMELPDGSKQALSTLHVRATEYTVGENGPKAMPGDLPPTSGYTYAVELSVDEAVAAGAKTVRFDKPVPVYVENFLNFPVGGIVPAGWYDREKSAWIPSDNGRVIKVIAVDNGLAQLDIDGSGNAADPAALATLGVDDAERRQLAGMYVVGTSLWRTPVTHFTPWDCNWPYGPPKNAKPPSPPKPPKVDKKVSKPECEGGSIIECQNQTLGERIPIAGTPFSLNYRSDRVDGRTSSRGIDIQLIGSEVPSGLKRIDVEITLAGKRILRSYPLVPNQSAIYVWDILDAFDRRVYSSQMAGVRIGYVYDAVYYQPAEFKQSFGLFSGLPMEGLRARQEIVIWQYQKVVVQGWKADVTGFGGWTISELNHLDVVAKLIRLGNGESTSISDVNLTSSTVAGLGSKWGRGIYGADGGIASQTDLEYTTGLATTPDGSTLIANGLTIRKIDSHGVISTIAGDGNPCSPKVSACGDGGPALRAQFDWIEAIAMDKQGNIYVLDEGARQIRHIDTNGTVSTVAGCSFGKTCLNNQTGDGNLAVNVALGDSWDLAVSADGSLYIADAEFHRIRRVAPNGIISTIAGTGIAGFSGDGGQARLAQVNFPMGVAVTLDGTIYISDFRNQRVRKISPAGIISTIAGTGTTGFSGDGGAAINAEVDYPWDIAVADDGAVIFADESNHRIRRISTEGMISSIAGSGKSAASLYPGATSYTRAMLGVGAGSRQLVLSHPADIALASDGSLMIADCWTTYIYKVASPVSGVAWEDIYTPSGNGVVVYHFNTTGHRHLRTLDARTRQPIYEFGYDDVGYLTNITDANNNVTRIERNGATPTAIIAPDGQRTELSVDQNGYLSSIRNPAGETHKATYTPDGLMLSFTDPRGATSKMTYDELGRLIADENAAGGGWKLARTELDNGYEVTMTSALGRKTTYRIENLPIGDQRRTTLHPDGTKSLKIIGADGTETSTDPDGTIQKVTYGPDPRFGMQAPLAAQVSLTLPSGLINKTSTTRTATLADKHDLLSLTAEVTTTTVNGRAYQSSYDAASRTLTSRTPTQRQAVTTLDEKGRTIASQLTGLAPLGYAYDARGRLSSISQGSGSDARSTHFQYGTDGYLASVTDAGSRTTNYKHDAAGRVTKQTLPDGRVIGYQYDANGNLTALTPPGREAHVFNYSTLNQQAGYNPPKLDGAATVTQYNYNIDKQLTRIDRPDGQAVSLAYDAGGRVTQVSHPDDKIGYGYHPATGQLSEIATRDQTLSYAFDGFLSKGETWSGTVSGSVTRSYDANFWTTQIAVNGQAINYQYDNDGLLTQAGDLGLTRNSANGLLTATSLGSTSTSYGYNTFGELINQGATASNNGLYSASYTRDALGRILTKTETLNGSTDTFGYSYDTAGRLVGVSKNGQAIAQYQYDANGNRIGGFNQQGNLSSSVDSQDRLIRQNNITFSYNANGDLNAKSVSGITSYFHYDALGNLRQAKVPNDITIDYVIDGKNRRVGKKINGALKQAFLYQDGLNPIAELDGQGNVVARFVYGTKPNVPDYMIKGGKTYRFVTDHLGSPRLIVDASSGEIAQRIDYDEFGNVLSDSNAGFQPFGFAGGLYDQHTGLIRFGARDYDPQTGRWTAKDPIRFQGGDGNLYGYVMGDPVNFVDPLGLWSIGIEAYVGFGGGVTIGRDNATGQPFLNIRVGYGIGGGFDYDPLAKRPGSDPCDKSSGEGVGVFGKVGGRVGPVKAGLGFNAGVQNGSSAYPTNPYGSFASPKVSYTNRGTGISASAAAGGEFTIYGRGI